MPFSSNRVWRQLPNETRVRASEVFWAGSSKEQKQLILATIAKAKNVREISVRRAPVERLVNWTAGTLTLPDAIVNNLLQEYLLTEHRAVIVSYMDLLGIQHTEGMIAEEFDLASLTKESIQDGARKLLASTDGAGAELYLKFLVVQGGPWAAIEEVLPAAE